MSEQEQFEQKIVSLLEGACTPDTQVVKQATKQLKKDLKRPATMIVLMKLVANHPETAIRWSAALYFRQKIVNHWDKLQPAQSQFQQTLLETISKEPHPSTRKALAEAIAVIARIALPAGQWDQLLPTLIGFSQDQNVANRQAAFKIFQSLTEGLGDDLASQYDQLHPILSNGMQDPDSEVQLFAINAIASIMPHLEEQFAPLIRNALPIIFQLVEKFMNEGRETETCDALEIFIYLVETPLPILEGDLFEQLIMFMLKIGTSPLPRSIRQSAMVVVEFAGMCHPKRIVRSGVLDAVFDALFVMSAEEPQGDEAYDDDEEEATDASSSYKYSCQLIDALCGELASQVTAPIVMNKINEYFNGSPRQRRTALGALAVICESLGEQLLEVVDQLVPSVLDSCQHEVDFVRLSAYVCMAHFAEHLAPAMQKHSRPVTLVLLGGAREQSMRVRGACLYAIRSLCDNLYDEVAAETAQLIAPPLIEMLRDPQSDYEFKEMVMSALTACANVTHEHFLPYLAPVMESIAEGLSLTDDTDPAQMGFRAQVSEASSVVAMAVGAEAFQPYFDGCVSQILSGMELNAPELRCCSYLFFSNLSQLLGEEFAPLLEPVMPFLLTALRAPTSAFEAELEHSDSEDDEDELAGDADDFAGSARSGVLVEKTQAAKSVGVIGLHAGAAFAPYLQPSIVALAQCLGHAYVDLRGSALLAMGQLTVLMHRRTSNDKKWERGSAAQNPISDETTQLVKVVMPMAIGGLIGDPHPEGAQNAANVARDILTEVGPAALEPFAASLGDAVLVVSRGKGSCQMALDAFDMSNDVAESGRDEDLLDAAWDLLVTAAKTSTPDFTVALLKAFVPELLKFTGDTYPPIFGALAIGTLGELVGASETDVSFCSGDVLQGCLRIIGRAEETSQVNASFCIGCLYSHGGEPVHSKTIDILRAMQPIFEQPLSERVADNACGALGRMLTSSVGAHVPLEVLPLFMKNLPIKDDDAEKVSAYSGLLALAERNASVFGNHVEDLTRIVASELVSDECPKEQLSGLVQLLKMMASDNNAQQIISNTASQLNDNERQMLQQALN